MRLDKYLKISRIIKRRTIAKAVCDQGKVKINDRVAKAGNDVSVDDTVEVDFGSKVVIFKVLKTLSHASKEDASTMYEVIDEKHVI
jgi:ribosomal 50S subunit-recycling heat shock protein